MIGARRPTSICLPDLAQMARNRAEQRLLALLRTGVGSATHYSSAVRGAKTADALHVCAFARMKYSYKKLHQPDPRIGSPAYSNCPYA